MNLNRFRRERVMSVSISSKFAVATHILVLLAVKREEQVTSEYIASSVNTNPVVVRRILGDLRRASIVGIMPGAGGGARLSRNPEQISLMEVYRAVESSPLFSMHHHSPNPLCPVGANIQTVLLEVFDDAEKAMLDSLGEATLAQLVQRVQNLAKEPAIGPN